MFSRIRGQSRVINILQKALQLDKIANSYLFHGPDGVGKFTTALYFGMALNCQSEIDTKPCGICSSCRKFLNFTHPDFVFIFPSPNLDVSPEGEVKSDKLLNEYQDYIKNKIETPWKEFIFSSKVEIRISSIRMLEHKINLTPNEAKYKVYIVEDAESMNINTANAFLKTLEEPPQDALIILTSANPNSLLPTILSRCQKITFQALPRDIIEKELIENRFLENIEAKLYARIANGSMEKALRLVDSSSIESRENALELIKIILDHDDLRFIEYASEFRSVKSQTKLAEIISHLIIWTSDLTYLKIAPTEIVNLDNTEMLEKMYLKNPAVENYVYDLIEYMEKTLKLLVGNINPQLVLTSIYHKYTGKLAGGI